MRDVMFNREKLNEAWIEQAKSDMLGYTYKYDDISHNSANSEVNSSSRKMSNFNWIAYMIYNNAIDNGYKDVPNNPEWIMAQYHHEHPDNWNTIINAVNNEDLNLLDFWIQQWWIPTEEDDKTNRFVDVLNTFFSAAPVLWNALENEWNSWAEVVWSIRDLFDNDNNPDKRDDAIWEWVKDNLSFAKFWKPYGMLSSKQKIELIEMARENPQEIQDKYRASFAKTFATTLAWWLDTAFTAALPWKKADISLMSNTPVVKYWMEALWAILQLWWWATTQLWDVWLKALWLPTIEEEIWAEEYYDVLNAAIWSALWIKMSRNKKVQKWTAEKLNNLVKTLRISELKPYYDAFKAPFEEWAYSLWSFLWKLYRWELWNSTKWWTVWDVVNKATWADAQLEWVMNMGREIGKNIYDKANENFFTPAKERTSNQADWNRRAEEVITPEEIENIKFSQNELSTKITGKKWKTNRQRDAVTNALNLLDRDVKSNIYNYEQLVNALVENEQKPFIEYEDRLLSKFNNKLKPSEIESMTSKELSLPDSENSVQYWRDPVKRARDAYRKMRKYNMENWKAPTEKDAAFEMMLDKYETEWATYLDLYNLARYLSKEFNLWKKNGSWEAKDSISAELINELRTELKSIARKEIAKQYPEMSWVLETLDKYYSDATVAIELLSDMVEAARAERWGEPLRNPAQEQYSSIYNKFKNIKDYSENLLFGWKKYTPNTIDSEMNYILKVQDEYFDKLWRKGYELNDIIDKINNLVIEDYNNNPELFNNKEYLDVYKWNLVKLLKWLGYKEEKVQPRIDPLFKNIEESLSDVKKEYVISDADTERLKSQLNTIKWTKSSLTKLKKAINKSWE